MRIMKVVGYPDINVKCETGSAYDMNQGCGAAPRLLDKG